MSNELIISLDAMGGDKAPEVVVEGAALSVKQNKNLRIIFFGEKAMICRSLDRYPSLKDVSDVYNCEKIVTMEDKPKDALKNAKETSMWQSIEAVKKGNAHAVLSAGNTGALMIFSKMLLGTLPGIDRPAIASLWPNVKGQSVVLDLGANIKMDENHLFSFSLMGAVLSKILLSKPNPTIGLLNIGTEEAKGLSHLQKACDKLSQVDGFFRFLGYVEGNDISEGTTDVVVTDGFTGNVALKTAEGTAKLLIHKLRKSIESDFFSRIFYFLAKRGFRAFKNSIDPGVYNGGIFLGLNYLAVKSHGGTDANGFSNAINISVDMAKNGLVSEIRKNFDLLQNQLQK